MGTKPYPEFVFEIWCWFAGWRITAQYLVEDGIWSKPRGRIVEFLAGLCQELVSPFWQWRKPTMRAIDAAPAASQLDKL